MRMLYLINWLATGLLKAGPEVLSHCIAVLELLQVGSKT